MLYALDINKASINIIYALISKIIIIFRDNDCHLPTCTF